VHRAGEAFTLRRNLTTPAVAGMVTAAIFKHLVLFTTSYEASKSTATPQEQIALPNKMLRNARILICINTIAICY